MRIALVSQQVSPVENPVGTELAQHAVRVRGLARTLAQMGHGVAVYARKDRPDLPDRCALPGGARVEHMAAGPPASLTDEQLLEQVPTLTAGLGTRWRKQRPDVVHAFDWTSGVAALAAGREIDTPVAQTFPSLGIAVRQHPAGAERVAPARIRLERAIGRSASTVLATTSAEAAALTDLGVPSAAIHVVPCGVDTDRFRPSGPAAKRTDRSRLVAVAALNGRSGYDILLRSLVRVPDAELIIASDLSRTELTANDTYRRLTTLARRLGLADRVLFACRVTDDTMPVLLRSADLLVDASWYEPSGVAALHAMACGIPVVAAAAGSHLDIVVDGITGLLVPPGRADLFARRIRGLLADPLLREGYGIAAADRVRARYSWERIGQETTAAYATVQR